MWIESMPYHQRYDISKELMPQLPPCFQETLMGEMIAGSTRQLRGPGGSHVHEFPDRWALHRDHVDAERDPFGHLIEDAPEYIFSIAAALLAGAVLGNRRQVSGQNASAALIGGLAGLMALIAGKSMKMLNGDEMPGGWASSKIRSSLRR